MSAVVAVAIAEVHLVLLINSRRHKLTFVSMPALI